MSADNYTYIKKTSEGYILSIGCASTDWQEEIGKYDTLEEAIREAPDTEYGTSFDLGENK